MKLQYKNGQLLELRWCKDSKIARKLYGDNVEEVVDGRLLVWVPAEAARLDDHDAHIAAHKQMIEDNPELDRTITSHIFDHLEYLRGYKGDILRRNQNKLGKAVDGDDDE